MGIKVDHTHARGKTCYVVSGRPRLTEAGLYTLAGQTFAAGYMPYTGHWYAYNPETGVEIATFSRGFFERCIRPHQADLLVEDPDCVPA